MVLRRALPRSHGCTCKRVGTNQGGARTHRVLRHLQQRRQDTPFVYPQETTRGNAGLATETVTHYRLFVPKPFRATHHHTWHFPAAQNLRRTLRAEHKGGLSALLPPPLRQKLFGEVQRHILAGRLDGTRKHRDHAHISPPHFQRATGYRR